MAKKRRSKKKNNLLYIGLAVGAVYMLSKTKSTGGNTGPGPGTYIDPTPQIPAQTERKSAAVYGYQSFVV